jgi:2-haloalkanoic acid dehalogenase type II
MPAMAAKLRFADYAALTFDCYGTLIDWEGGIVAALAPWRRRTGLAADDETLLVAFGAAESRFEAAHPTMLYSDLLAEVQKDLGKRFDAPATDAEAKAFGQSVKDWPAFPDSAEALAYLKRHHKLVILSNVDRASFAHSARKLGVDFDLVVTAQDVGSYKPTLNHFNVGLEKLAGLGVPKAKVLHVAQSLFHDHVPAKQVGLPTVWINRRGGTGSEGATPQAEAVTPDLEVPSMAALVELHRRQGG